MNIRGRLLVHAALVPALVITGLVGAGGLLLRKALLDSVDESLLAQAAVESISLFDLAESPHLHLGKSLLRSEVQSFTPARAVYGPDGERLVMDEGPAPLPERFPLHPHSAHGRPELRTLEIDGRSVRELELRVLAPDHRPHTLLMRSALDRVDGTLNTYFRVLGLAALFFIGLLILVQARLSAWWAERIANMIRHTRRIEQGDMASRPAADSTRDEIGELTLALTRAAEKLEQARQAQERLVADAAHELKTPLAAMRAEIDVTLRRSRDAEALGLALAGVRDEVDRLDGLSTQLLNLTRIAHATLNLEPGDVRTVLDAAVEAHFALARDRGVEVKVDGPARVPARFDPVALRQAFDNLLSNAIKFAREGGQVRVRLELEGEKWRLAVDDDGPGIPKAEREAVFEPFRRVDPRTPGAGLGLAIVRDVALRHRARAFVADAPEGTRLVFEAPTAPTAADEPKRP